MLQRAWQLPPREWAGLGWAYLALLRVDLLLRLRGFRNVARLDRQPEDDSSLDLTRAQRERVARYVRWIRVAAQYHVVRARCLHRSLALHQVLLREGLPAQLRIGVRLQASELQAHAWVELGGIVVNDSREHVARFAPLQGLDSASPSRTGIALISAGRGWTA